MRTIMLRVAPGGGPGVQLVVQPGHGAVIAPGAEVTVDGLPRPAGQPRRPGPGTIYQTLT